MRGQPPLWRRFFFGFFETTDDLDPYLAYEKFKPHIHNNTPGTWLPRAFPNPESFRGKSAARWRLSQLHHGGRDQRPQKPHHRRWKRSSWLVFALHGEHRQLQHRRRRGDAHTKHRRQQYGDGCCGAFSQQNRHQQYSRRFFRAPRTTTPTETLRLATKLSRLTTPATTTRRLDFGRSLVISTALPT
jgi:hypothetical protein